MALQSDATISDVWDKLANPQEYIEGVLKHLLDCKMTHGSAVVRIGVTGTGQKPYYWIMHLTPSGDRIPFAAYFDNHGPFSAENKEACEGTTWSSKVMTLKSVAALYALKV